MEAKPREREREVRKICFKGDHLRMDQCLILGRDGVKENSVCGKYLPNQGGPQATSHGI